MRRRAPSCRTAEDRHLGAEARQEARGAAGFGQRDHRAHLDVLGQEHAGHRDRLVGALEVARRRLEIGVAFELALGAEADAHHRLDRLAPGSGRRRFSAESITASVPSITALATSSTSARVGIGLSTIDCSICVAVITTRLCSSACG
jgi:hypothetical protein